MTGGETNGKKTRPLFGRDTQGVGASQSKLGVTKEGDQVKTKDTVEAAIARAALANAFWPPSDDKVKARMKLRTGKDKRRAYELQKTLKLK